MQIPHTRRSQRLPLNESPSEKEGKSLAVVMFSFGGIETLNESPSEKEGK